MAYFLAIFLKKFLTFPEILGSIEFTGWVNPFCISGYALLFLKKAMILGNFFDLVTVFWTFLANYPAKSNIIGLIETTGVESPFL